MTVTVKDKLDWLEELVTWLYRIALNLAYSNARRRCVRKKLERTWEVSEDAEDYLDAVDKIRHWIDTNV